MTPCPCPTDLDAPFAHIEILAGGAALLLISPPVACSSCRRATMIGYIPPREIGDGAVRVLCSSCEPFATVVPLTTPESAP